LRNNTRVQEKHGKDEEENILSDDDEMKKKNIFLIKEKKEKEENEDGSFGIVRDEIIEKCFSKKEFKQKKEESLIIKIIML
jgi:hypothetical protein